MFQFNIKNILEKYHIKPNKFLGQNFLINEHILDKIAETAKISKKDTAVEIGPGIGNLTKKLCAASKEVIAIEKDKNLINILKNELSEFRNLKIIQEDALKIDISKILPKKYKVVANIPYYITAPIIRKFLEAESKPETITLLIQKEVAQRICSLPPKMNLLALSVQIYGKPKIIDIVKRGNFWPVPKVDSAILQISDIKNPKNIDLKKLFKIIKIGFSQPRKQLLNNLVSGLSLPKEKITEILKNLGISEKSRPENLSISNWIKITKKLNVYHLSTS